jgi:membrane associated rhomboid family serine protease
MIAGRHSEDYEPITWVGRFPIYITTLLVALHVAALVGVAMAMAFTGAPSPAMSPWLQPLIYSSADVLRHFSLWQLVSYAFVSMPSLWFVVEMWMLYTFGREVEKFLGRRAFLWLYLALVLVGPLALTLLGLAGVNTLLAGGGTVHFALFVAFVVIYPAAEIFFSFQAKWVALVLLALYSLQCLAYRTWTDLGVLWLECACAVAILHFAGVSNASLSAWLPEREEPAPPRRRARRQREEPDDSDPYESIDPLLEKISRHGIGSLTKRERQRLEQARAALLEKEKPHR